MSYQQVIGEYLKQNGTSKKSDMYKDLKVSSWYYANASKHFGDILSRMVKNGLIIRISKGVYEFGNYSPRNKKYFSTDKNQTSLI